MVRKPAGTDKQEIMFGSNQPRPGMPPPPSGKLLHGSHAHALQDYQMELMLKEQQNKKRLLMARQEQDNISGSHQQGRGVAPEPNMKFPDPNLAPPGMPPQFYPPSSHPGANFNSQQLTSPQMEAMRDGQIPWRLTPSPPSMPPKPPMMGGPMNPGYQARTQPKDTLRKVNGGRVESRMRPRGSWSLSRTTSFPLRSIERGSYERSDRSRLENLQNDLDIAKARRLPGTAINYTISEDDTISGRERSRRQLFALEVHVPHL
jgi:hypothetical protein